MADPTVRAFSSVGPVTDNPVVITKPAGLAVGDLMVWFVCSGNGYPTDPAGWQKLDQSPAQQDRVTVYTKTATAGDVAAANFSLTNGSALHVWSVMYAVQNSGGVTHHASGWQPSGASLYLTGYTAAQTGELLLSACEAGADPTTFTSSGANITSDVTTGGWWVYRGCHSTNMLSTNQTSLYWSIANTTHSAAAVVAIGHALSWQESDVASDSIYLGEVAQAQDSIDLIATQLDLPIGGNGVDVLDADFVLERHGGMTSATLEIIPPKGVSRHSDDVLEPVMVTDTNGHELWEGRIEEPDIEFLDADRQKIECNGYGSYLTDDQHFMRCYIDASLENWQFKQATKWAGSFEVGIVNDDEMVFQVDVSGQPLLDGESDVCLPKDAEARAYWQLCDGVNGLDSRDYVRRISFKIKGDGVEVGGVPDDLLEFQVWARPNIKDVGSSTKIWSCRGDFMPGGPSQIVLCSDKDDPDAHAGQIADIPVNTRCVLFKIQNVAGAHTHYVSMVPLGYTPDESNFSLDYGWLLSKIKIYASPLDDDLAPETIVRDLVGDYFDEEHRDFPDSSGKMVGHYYLKDPTTRGDAIETINNYLDWNYGTDDQGVFFYEKPYTKTNIPMEFLIVTSFADPCLLEWDVRNDYSECYNKVYCRYQTNNNRPAEVVVSNDEGPYGTVWRTAFIDHSSDCDNDVDATEIATAYLNDHLWPVPTGTIKLGGDIHVPAGDGFFIPAIYAKPGWRVVNMDVAPRDAGRLLVVSVQGNRLRREVTLTVGQRQARLDRLIAKHELEIKKFKRIVSTPAWTIRIS